MNLMCLLGFHNWRRVGIIKPIRTEGEFIGGSGFCEGHSALGECLRCGKKKLRQCGGRFTWYRLDEVTEEEYLEKFESGEYKRE